MKKLLIITVVLFAIGCFAYRPLFTDSPAPTTTYPLDIAKVRALASSLPGDKPREVRYEKVMAFGFAEAMVVAGDPWKETPIPVYSYQLVYPSQTLIVDATMNREIAKPDFLVNGYDDAAYARVGAAMEKASQIVITHEHMDHIGGIAAHPHLDRLLPLLRPSSPRPHLRPILFPHPLSHLVNPPPP